MNKYRDKSDFEINKDVAKCYLTHDFRLNSIDEIVELIDVDLYREYGVDNYEAINKKPYRAAMEVFLMMKDAENEKI